MDDTKANTTTTTMVAVTGTSVAGATTPATTAAPTHSSGEQLETSVLPVATALAAEDDVSRQQPQQHHIEEGGNKDVVHDGEASTAAAERPTDRSGSLKALAPTLSRMAVAAHKVSAPYLNYAAQASQEAARYTEAKPGRLAEAVLDFVNDKKLSTSTSSQNLIRSRVHT